MTTSPLGLAGFMAEGAHHSRVSLLPSFELCVDGVEMPLPQAAERLLAFLALHDRPLDRTHVASSLRLDATDAHAAASLRSTLWRLHQSAVRVVDATSTRLRLGRDVWVDLREGIELTRRLAVADVDDDVWSARSISLLGNDLLPGWYADDWLILRREQWRQTRLHALEQIATGLVRQGDFALAVQAAIAAIQAEPLRESGYRCVVNVHLAEGNVVEAVMAYERFRELIGRELGLPPSPEFTRTMTSLRTKVSQ